MKDYQYFNINGMLLLILSTTFESAVYSGIILVLAFIMFILSALDLWADRKNK